MRKNAKGILAAFILVCVVITVLFSAVFVLTHTNHDCIGDGCPVCAEIQICQSVLKTLSSGSGATLWASFAIALFLFAILSIGNTVFNQDDSLITYKVRLNI